MSMKAADGGITTIKANGGKEADMENTVKTLNVKLDQETKEKLKELAKAENRTVSGYIKNFILTEYAKLKD